MALGPFDKFFDSNHDGKLNTFEKGMKWAFYASMAEEAANDDTDYSFRRRRGEAFDSDSIHCNGRYEYDGSGPKAFEDDPSEYTEKPEVVSRASVNAQESETVKIEVPKSKNKTNNSIILIVALLVIGLAYAIVSAAIHKNHIAQIEGYCTSQAKIVADDYDLDFEKVELHENYGELSGSYSADYYLNGMHNLEYSRMYDLGEELWCLNAPCGDEHVLVFLNLICSNGDEYKINTITRSIYLNDKKIDDDFVNTKYYKEKHTDKSGTSSTYSSNTPYVGMYVGSSGHSGWIVGGTDYDTCTMTTTKYHYKTDNAYYVIWVNPKTNRVVKVQGGPSATYAPKKTASPYTDDEYDTSSYSNAEDFYDDNYDNFFDYYDAEDYYNEHSD